MPTFTQTQIVLITGANQGIGFAAAKLLSKLANHHVIIGSRNLDKGQAAADKIMAEGAISPVSTLVVDLDNDKTLLAAAAHIEKEFGKLDVLVVSKYPSFELRNIEVRTVRHLRTTPEFPSTLPIPTVLRVKSWRRHSARTYLAWQHSPMPFYHYSPRVIFPESSILAACSAQSRARLT
jgi:NAD(P)-dependent dehydrogenase (short-subunit alcohol dehydrogenase family)